MVQESKTLQNELSNDTKMAASSAVVLELQTFEYNPGFHQSRCETCHSACFGHFFIVFRGIFERITFQDLLNESYTFQNGYFQKLRFFGIFCETISGPLLTCLSKTRPSRVAPRINAQFNFKRIYILFFCKEQWHLPHFPVPPACSESSTLFQ